mgnify:CR=1 FL=1
MLNCVLPQYQDGKLERGCVVADPANRGTRLSQLRSLCEHVRQSDVLVLVQEDALEGEVLPARVRDLAREVHEAESALAELTMHGEATALHRHLLRGEHLARGIREEAPEVAQGGAAPHEGVHARKKEERAGARRDEVGRDEGRRIGSRDVREVARDES